MSSSKVVTCGLILPLLLGSDVVSAALLLVLAVAASGVLLERSGA
jgi:hypothetical protein